MSPACAGSRPTAPDPSTRSRQNNRTEHLPRLRRWDGQGGRIEAVDHHPSYAEIGRLTHRGGARAHCATPGNELASIALVYLIGQNGESGHACPMACTAGMIKFLQAAGNPRPDWLSRLLDPQWRTHWRGAQFLTEVQGGSDVGSNAVRAVGQGDGTARPAGAQGGTPALAA